MKVLFLDIDGVLNCAECFKREHDAWVEKGKPKDEHWNMLDPVHIARLNRIVAETGAKIVVSSSWRGDPNLYEKLKEAGVVATFLGQTPRMPRPVGTSVEYCERGKEVKAFLEEWEQGTARFSTKPIVNETIWEYAILDDDRDFLPDQPLFKTVWEVGLTEEIADKVIAHLK